MFEDTHKILELVKPIIDNASIADPHHPINVCIIKSGKGSYHETPGQYGVRIDGFFKTSHIDLFVEAPGYSSIVIYSRYDRCNVTYNFQGIVAEYEYWEYIRNVKSGNEKFVNENWKKIIEMYYKGEFEKGD